MATVLKRSVAPQAVARGVSRPSVQRRAVVAAAQKTDVRAAMGAAAVAMSLLVSQVPVALADDGQSIFDGNCAACHMGGGNSVIPDHTLQKDAIEKYLTGGFSLDAIVNQVTNGKGAMPAWADRLDEDEIQAVAKYVYDTASNNAW